MFSKFKMKTLVLLDTLLHLVLLCDGLRLPRNGCLPSIGKCEESVKPGFCPPPTKDDLEGCLTPNWERLCSIDSDCDGNEKCCNNGCGLMCTEVKVENEKNATHKKTSIETPWTCPDIADEMDECDVSCMDGMENNCLLDEDCKESEKCCSDGCMLRCLKNGSSTEGISSKATTPPTAPTLSWLNPGLCPILTDEINECPPLETPYPCLLDSDCEESEKCCSNGCVLQCVKVGTDGTEEIVTATTPTTEMAQPTTPLKSLEKSWTCPNIVVKVDECYDPSMENDCLLDDDCKESEKCCSDGCMLRCMKNGTTTEEIVTTTTPTTETTQPTTPLNSFEKSWTCPKIAAKMDGCYDPSMESGYTYCFLDDVCKESEKCCFDGCTLRCIKNSTTAEKISTATLELTKNYCPAIDDDLCCEEMDPSIENCVLDEDCEESEKCCPDGCILRCVKVGAEEISTTTPTTTTPPTSTSITTATPSATTPTTTPSPTTAPPTPTTTTPTPATPPTTIPATTTQLLENTWTCPEVSDQTDECPSQVAEDCFLDEDCEESEKCCSDGCNLRCVKVGISTKETEGTRKETIVKVIQPAVVSPFSL